MFPSVKSIRGNINEKWISLQLEQGEGHVKVEVGSQDCKV
jgi:hypothetical protein